MAPSEGIAIFTLFYALHLIVLVLKEKTADISTYTSKENF